MARLGLHRGRAGEQIGDQAAKAREDLLAGQDNIQAELAWRPLGSDDANSLRIRKNQPDKWDS